MIRSRPRLAAKASLCLLLLSASARPAGAAAADPQVQSLLDLRGLDARVLQIGHRLATANLGVCPSAAMLPGFAVHDLSQYGGEYRRAAQVAFGLGRGPGILAVAAGSGAARAGLRPDDVLVAIDGVAADGPAAGGKRAQFDTVERVLDRIDRAVADGRAELRLLRGREELRVQMQPDRGCASRFQTLPSQEPDAKADGKYVQVTSAMVEYVRSDDELAAVLAHELAHNILRHRARLDAAGISRGLLKSFGRNARLIRQTEAEADQLSVYLMDRAGYSPAAAATFWRRFGREHAGGIFASTTHPLWKKRVAALEEEKRRLDLAKRESAAPVPPLLAAPLPELK